MHEVLALQRWTRSAIGAFVLIAVALQALATDIFTAPNGLNISSLRIGNGTYSNVVLTIGTIVTLPSGTSAKGTEDSYNPANNQLMVQAVQVGSTTDYNAVVTVGHLTSIGSVSGADTFDGTHLHVPYVLVGATPYYNVVLNISLANVVALHGGMPSVQFDQYNASAGQLTIPAVQFGSKVYTNVVLKVAHSDIVSVGLTESVLYSFGTSPNDGIMPLSSLIQGNDGNFYGTTSSGGTIGGGALIKVTPGGIESVLYSFGGFGAPDGSVPEGNLIQANDGNFYTITGFGGANKAGAVVKITPAGTASVLYSNAVPGDGPIGGLIQASDGNLYGMTNLGGANGTGAVIKITLAGVESVLHSFGATGSGDGVGPNGGLIQASDGNLYGLTLGGGAYSDGAVIKITPAGAESVLYSFGPHAADGYDPLFSLVQASDGNLYAVTLGGAHSVGAVVKITLAGTGSVLYSFGSQPGDGYASVGSLIQASDGNLYGLTNQGGANFFGTAFRVTLAGTETVLYAFSTASNGGSDPQVQGSLIQASDGNLYGMTTFGGVTGADGAVIKFTW